MKIYIDSEYKCASSKSDESHREVETSFFDGKCKAYIEGFRFIPASESWTRADGATFTGEMASPWKNFDELDAAQREYERQLLAEYAEALKVVGVIE